MAILARYAGTFVSSPAYMKIKRKSFSVDTVEIEHWVLSLCQAVLGRRNRIVETHVIVPLLKAIRYLYWKFPTEGLVRELAATAENAIALEEALEKVIGSGGTGWQRRANETLTSYVSFIGAKAVAEGPADKDSSKFGMKKAMAEAYDRVQGMFPSDRLPLDAANLLERSKLVFIRSKRDTTRIMERAQLLRDAEFAIRNDVRNQGEWSNRLRELVRAFESLNGSIERYIGQEGATARVP